MGLMIFKKFTEIRFDRSNTMYVKSQQGKPQQKILQMDKHRKFYVQNFTRVLHFVAAVAIMIVGYYRYAPWRTCVIILGRKAMGIAIECALSIGFNSR